jgi:DNA invertase Pin-like site-specific DNA recombinase
MRAGLYARVSTSDKGQDPEMQNREMREFCDRRQWTLELFTDRGYSGSKVSRPELDRLMTACRRRKIDVVVVYRFDRFARSVKHLVDALTEFNDLGVQFVSLHENVDTTTAQGKLLFHIFAAIAEFERELTRGRVLSGLATARAKGVKLGRPRCQPDIERIRELRRRGMPWDDVARAVGVSRATAKRAFLLAQKPLSEALQ